MANKGFILMDAYLTRTAKLTDEELGRLMRACMVYHATGEIVELEGRESVAFDFIKEDIDFQNEAYQAKCETNRRNRMGTNRNDGQRPSSNVNDRPPEPTAAHNENVNENENVNVNDIAAATRVREEADAEAIRIQADHDRIMEAAENAGFPQSNTVRAKLLDAYAAHGLEKTLRAIEECATHSAASIAYLQAVLNGKPRGKGQPAKTVTAQQYSQRDYSGYEPTQDETMKAITQFLQQTG